MTLGRLALLACLLLAGRPARADVTLDDRLHALSVALQRWDLATARWHARHAVVEHPGAAAALLGGARVAFYESDYARALELARRAVAAGDESAREMVAYLEERKPTWSSFTEHGTGTFRVRVTPRDEILAPFALQALEAAATAMDRDLGYCPEDPVVVEIYPNRRSFIAASTLTREEVDTSGTVAICHFNRIMLISPAAMALGYPWLDTVCHEYVHHVIYHVGTDAVPVWLHEGIAKSLEARWREDGAGLPRMDPRLSSVLAEGRAAGRWVTFDEIHPSMAKLPSASLVHLAFAQVSATVRGVIEEGGTDRIALLLQSMGRGSGDVEASFREVLGFGLAELEDRARRRIAAMELYRIPGSRELDDDAPAMVFKDEGDVAPDPEADAKQLEDRQARDYTVLADRLKGRRFWDAAVIEYDKAIGRLGHGEPQVVNRKALSLISAGRLDDARAVLEPLLLDHPSLTTTLDNLAEVHLQLSGRSRTDAREHDLAALDLLRRSEAVNPFNPDTQVRLVTLLERLARREEAEVARERLRTILEEQRR
jgi:tetratricopeptide (TPR) repeat protein